MNEREVSVLGYDIIVSYCRENMLKNLCSAGKYVFVNPNITDENFLTNRDGNESMAIELFQFGRDASTDEVLRELEVRGLRPAKAAELLTFAIKYPAQRRFPVVALGQHFENSDGELHVIFLHEGDFGRSLYLNWFEGRWDRDYRFAAVRRYSERSL